MLACWQFDIGDTLIGNTPPHLFPVCDCRQLHPVIEWIPRGMLILSDHPRALSDLQTSHIGPCWAFVSLMAAVYADIHVSVGDKKSSKILPHLKESLTCLLPASRGQRCLWQQVCQRFAHETSWCNVSHIFSHSECFICWFLIFWFYIHTLIRIKFSWTAHFQMSDLCRWQTSH